MPHRKQLNTRVPAPIRDAMDVVANKAGFKPQEMVEVALATILGSQDGLVREKRKKILQAVEQARANNEISLSFDGPGSQLIQEELPIAA